LQCTRLLRIKFSQEHTQFRISHAEQVQTARKPLWWLLHSGQHRSPNSAQNFCMSGLCIPQMQQWWLCTVLMFRQLVHTQSADSLSGTGERSRSSCLLAST